MIPSFIAKFFDWLFPEPERRDLQAEINAKIAEIETAKRQHRPRSHLYDELNGLMAEQLAEELGYARH
ncbi:MULTISPECIES: hypothetical protein [Brucella]|uniref:hypothetical protein n=1 Tax=Brucella TaxID=234 RepID=UPI00384ECED6